MVQPPLGSVVFSRVKGSFYFTVMTFPTQEITLESITVNFDAVLGSFMLEVHESTAELSIEDAKRIIALQRFLSESNRIDAVEFVSAFRLQSAGTLKQYQDLLIKLSVQAQGSTSDLSDLASLLDQAWIA